MVKKSLCILSLSCAVGCVVTNSAQAKLTSPGKALPIQNQPIEIRISYDQLKMPRNISQLGILGIHELVNFTPYIYGGLGQYGAVRGESGAYFALSLDGGFQYPIFDPVWIDLGGSLGAGGGRRTPVGGGLYVQPYAGLSFHFDSFNLSAFYKYTRFTDGDISSSYWGAAISFPNILSLADASFAGQTANITKINNIEMSRNYIGVVGQFYWPEKGTKTIHGKLNDSRISMIGAEYGHFITKYGLIFAKTTGAFHGQGNGFADALIGLGYQLPLMSNNLLKLIGKIGIGSAGGADVDTGGGFIVNPTLGLEWRICPSLALEVNGGYLDATGGHFKVMMAEAIAKYYFDNVNLTNYVNLSEKNDFPSILDYRGFRMRLSHLTYFSPKTDRGTTNPNMQLANLNLDYRLSDYFYFTGQGAFAYQGKNAGGYFSGLLGLGAQTYKFGSSQKLGLFAEAMFGTAGGAGLDIGSGSLVEPLIGVSYKINSSWEIQTSVGELIALKGKFKSTVFNAGVGYSFATLGT